MEIRKRKVILFKKSFFILILSSLILLCSILNKYSLIYLRIKFLEISSISLGFSFLADEISFMFFLIVFCVVSLVSLFRELYMEHYNNKKFYFIKLFFFFSMLILASSGGLMNLIVGWDWLGISSLFLIIFYPNKLTLYNSYLTIIFNRLGDGILILILCFFLLNLHNFFFFIRENLILISVAFILCSFTKRAQFPLSSWLPAAISAPTPISAIVHSSTLVTAGLYILFKINFYIAEWKICYLFITFRIMRFLIGGLIAKIETDFKKIVAFSTIRQIRIIIFFLFLGLLILGRWHMVIHAFFKTILFCCCGSFFLGNFSDQIFRKMNIKFPIKIYLLLFLSIFSITGLTFCRSYTSKDKILEFFILSTNQFFFILLTGRIFTLIYCRKIIETFKQKYIRSTFSKKELFSFFTLFRLISLILGKLILLLFPLLSYPICSKRELLLLLIILFSFVFFEIEYNKFKFLKYITLDISLIKRLTFRLWNKINKNFFFLIFINSDRFIFKPRYLSLKKKKLNTPFFTRYFNLYFLAWIALLT